MKKLYSQEFSWKSPLEIFPLVKEMNPHLFFSGSFQYSNQRSQSGKFSFIPFSAKKNWNILNPSKKNWKNIQKTFFSEKENREPIPKEWKFPFSGGIAGVFSYDFLRTFEDIPENEKMEKEIPCSFLGVYEKFFAFDHKKKIFSLAGWFKKKETSEKFFQIWGNKIKKMYIKKERNVFLEKHFSPEISQEEYKKKFTICQQEIEKGNSFQINFSQKFLAETKNSAWDIFLEATRKNPAPMMYFYETNLNAINFSCISCSPERLFSSNRFGEIFTQPIAGTRPRGKNILEEKKLEHELNTSKKEQSEHSMLVDLLRNDFGKVSQFGSIYVKKFGRIEKYTTVMHLVSDIIGKISPKKNIFDVFEAVFPGGTITGAPKTETMKILAREEISSRNFYCGSAGYFSFCNASDWNILIRTLEKQNEKISVRAGGGLVFGANPENEYQETLHKFSGIKKIFTPKKVF